MDQVKNIVGGIVYGIYDSILGLTAILYIQSYNKDEQRQRKGKAGNDRRKSINILQRYFQCCALNGGLFGASILIFDYFVLNWLYIFMKFLFGSEHGTVSSIWFWLKPTLSYTFSAFWVLPLFLLSRFVNALWFQDIADTAYRGRPQTIKNISKFIADTLFSLIIQALFLLQALLVEFFPISLVGQIVGLFHISLLYSLYSFEYKWFNMGWELHQRLHFIENNWPYFLGFGLPLAISTMIPHSYFISGCIFSILFPLFIISANEAKPKSGIGIPLQMFSGVVWLSNNILFFIFKFDFMGNQQTGAKPKKR